MHKRLRCEHTAQSRGSCSNCCAQRRAWIFPEDQEWLLLNTLSVVVPAISLGSDVRRVIAARTRGCWVARSSRAMTIWGLRLEKFAFAITPALLNGRSRKLREHREFGGGNGFHQTAQEAKGIPLSGAR